VFTSSHAFPTWKRFFKKLRAKHPATKKAT